MTERDQHIIESMPYVYTVAKAFHGRYPWISTLEFASAGAMLLCKSVDKYMAEPRDVSLVQWCTRWIRTEMRDEVRRLSWHTARKDIEMVYIDQQVIESIGGRSPDTVDEIERQQVRELMLKIAEEWREPKHLDYLERAIAGQGDVEIGRAWGQSKANANKYRMSIIKRFRHAFGVAACLCLMLAVTGCTRIKYGEVTYTTIGINRTLEVEFTESGKPKRIYYATDADPGTKAVESLAKLAAGGAAVAVVP